MVFSSKILTSEKAWRMLIYFHSTSNARRQDYFGGLLQYFAPFDESLLCIPCQPLYFIAHFFQHTFFGTGASLASVLQIAVFACTAHLDTWGCCIGRPPDMNTIRAVKVMHNDGLAERDKSRGEIYFLIGSSHLRERRHWVSSHSRVPIGAQLPRSTSTTFSSGFV